MKSIVFIFAFLCLVVPAQACEEFKKVERDDAQKSVELLEKEQGSSINKIYAFDTLACSDDPALRRLAKEAGLASKNPLLKSKAFLATIYDRKGLSLILLDDKLGEHEKDWVKRNGGMIIIDFYKRDYSKGCINLSSNFTGCPSDRSVHIEGLKIMVGFSLIRAELSLVDGNTLRGFLKPNENLKAIPVKADLF